MRTSAHVCRLHLVRETRSYPSYKGATLSLDTCGPVVCLKLKLSFMEKEGAEIEDFMEVTQFIRVLGLSALFSFFKKNGDIIDV